MTFDHTWILWGQQKRQWMLTYQRQVSDVSSPGVTTESDSCFGLDFQWNSSWVKCYFESNSSEGLLYEEGFKEGGSGKRKGRDVKPGKVIKSSKEVKIKLNYHKGWHVAMVSVAARNISPQNTSPGLQKSVFDPQLQELEGGISSIPSPCAPQILSQQNNTQRSTPLTTWTKEYTFLRSLHPVIEFSASAWASPAAGLLFISISLGSRQFLSPTRLLRFCETYRNSISLKQFQLWETSPKHLIW